MDTNLIIYLIAFLLFLVAMVTLAKEYFRLQKYYIDEKIKRADRLQGKVRENIEEPQVADTDMSVIGNMAVKDLIPLIVSRIPSQYSFVSGLIPVIVQKAGINPEMPLRELINSMDNNNDNMENKTVFH